MTLFSKKDINKLLQNSHIGLWRIEFEEGKPPRLFADEVMDKLLGVEKEVTPEERCELQRSCIHEDDVETYMDYSNKLAYGRAEIVYRYKHPRLGIRFVRCNGIMDGSVKEYLCINGTHQDITDTIRLEKDKLAEQRLPEENQYLKKSILAMNSLENEDDGLDSLEASISLEERIAINRALIKPYKAIYYCDLENWSFIELGCRRDYITQALGKSGSLKDRFEDMCNKLIAPEYVAGIREFCSLDTIIERLKDKPWISYQYKGRHGWSGATFIVVRRDAEGNCTRLIGAIRDITDSMETLMAQKRALLEAKEEADKANSLKDEYIEKFLQESQDKAIYLYKSQHDMMTQLLRKDVFLMEAEAFLQEKKPESIALIFIDIDNFKEVNDTLGHLLGDKVICDVADIIRTSMANKDLICRYGGDEFCVLMKAVTKEKLVDKLQFLHKKYQLDYTKGDNITHVTCSIGAVFYERKQGPVDIIKLIEKADKNLYLGKENGRNQFVCIDYNEK